MSWFSMKVMAREGHMPMRPGGCPRPSTSLQYSRFPMASCKMPAKGHTSMPVFNKTGRVSKCFLPEWKTTWIWVTQRLRNLSEDRLLHKINILDECYIWPQSACSSNKYILRTYMLPTQLPDHSAFTKGAVIASCKWV